MSIISGMAIEAGGPAAVTLSYLVEDGSEDDASSYTFTSQSLGTAASDRRIIGGAYGLDNSGNTISVSSVSVAGISGSQLVSVANNTSLNNVAALWSADVPTGTTGNIVITFSETVVKMGMALWRITGGAGGTVDTKSSTSDNFTLSITANANGAIIGFAGNRQGLGVGGTSWTWTGLTENYEGNAGTASHSGASDTFVSGGSKTVGASVTNSLGACTVFASF